jgi:hypothetical protein
MGNYLTKNMINNILPEHQTTMSLLQLLLHGRISNINVLNQELAKNLPDSETNLNIVKIKQRIVIQEYMITTNLDKLRNTFEMLENLNKKCKLKNIDTVIADTLTLVKTVPFDDLIYIP